MLADGLNPASADLEYIETEIVEPEPVPLILEDLKVLAEKMRSLMESQGGDYALGFEMGMQRAADMVENLIRQYSEENRVG